VWQETQPGEFSMMALDRLTPTTSLKDIVGYYARRCATWDFSNQAAMTAELNTQDPDPQRPPPFHRSHPAPGRSDVVARAAEQSAGAGCLRDARLIPAGSGAGRVVTVNLRKASPTPPAARTGARRSSRERHRRGALHAAVEQWQQLDHLGGR
jgi:hypothetical protein